MAEHRSTVRICCVAFLIWVAAAGSAGADPPTRESWPEIDTWLRLSSAWRLAVFVPLAENLDTHYREGNLILQADYGWAESKRTRRLVDEDRAQKMQIWLLRGGYLGGKSLDDHGAEYTEYTAFAELHLRLPLAHGILLSHRLRSDLRWLGEGDAEFSTQWRYRLLAEKDFTAGRCSIVPYVSVEPYFDSHYDTVNRVRVAAGASVGWSPRAAIESNVTYQHDSHAAPGADHDNHGRSLIQEKTMKKLTVGCLFACLVLAALAQPAHAQDLQQKLAAVKQSIGANQQALRSYTWLEKTELRLKGEVKATKVDSCRYGPDGKVQKTPVVQPPPAEKKRGLRGKIIANKTEEMKEELQATVALIQQYIPPDSGMIQVVMNAGTASVSQAGSKALAFTFPGYVKAGDALSITFDKEVTRLLQMDVKTWLEKPEEPATLRVTMQSMPNGISFPGSIVLSIPASKLEVRITKSNYQKLAM